MNARKVGNLDLRVDEHGFVGILDGVKPWTTIKPDEIEGVIDYLREQLATERPGTDLAGAIKHVTALVANASAGTDMISERLRACLRLLIAEIDRQRRALSDQRDQITALALRSSTLPASLGDRLLVVIDAIGGDTFRVLMDHNNTCRVQMETHDETGDPSWVRNTHVIAESKSVESWLVARFSRRAIAGTIPAPTRVTPGAVVYDMRTWSTT